MYTYCIHTTNVVAVPLALLLGLRLVLLLGGKLCLGGRLRLLPDVLVPAHESCQAQWKAVTRRTQWQ